MYNVKKKYGVYKLSNAHLKLLPINPMLTFVSIP